MTRSSKHALSVLLLLALTGCASKPAVRPDRPGSQTEAGGAATQPTVKLKVPVKDANTQFEEALAALKSRKFAEARSGFALLAKEHPEFSGPLTNLGILDAKSDARGAAIHNFTRAVQTNPRNAIAYNWLGILYRESRDYSRAEQAYKKSLELNPDNANVVLNLGILYDVYLNHPVDALIRYREYQRLTSNRELKVTAWIKALEAITTAAPPQPQPQPQPQPTDNKS